MNTKISCPLLFCLLLVLEFSAMNSFAENPTAKAAKSDPERWYQIELLVFQQRTHAGEPEEKWRHDIVLAYPPNWVELKPVASSAEQTASTGRDTVDLTHAVDLTHKVDLTREPYYFLPDKERQLTAQANTLKKKANYEILFHQAWRQSLVNKDSAPALLIEGGKTYGEHRELEGSVTLSVSRYLHIHTNLWLSRFKPNYGQEFADWPELPKKPNLNVDDVNSTLLGGTEQNLWADTNDKGGKYSSILSRPYIIDQIVTLQQTRKMRSGELHYIDHPILGVLIKIIPYNFPAKKIPADNSGPV